MLGDDKNTDLLISRIDADFVEENYQPKTIQKEELDSSLEEISKNFKSGTIVTGKVVAKESGGIVVGIDYKSDGLIPNHEFSNFEIDEIENGSDIEVFLEKLEDADGKVVLSYQKAKSMKAWGNIIKIFEGRLSILD